jgi:hypothetical protein
VSVTCYVLPYSRFNIFAAVVTEPHTKSDGETWNAPTGEAWIWNTKTDTEWQRASAEVASRIVADTHWMSDWEPTDIPPTPLPSA